MNLPPSKPHPELDALIAKAKTMPPMTPAELQAQRISFAYGNLPLASPLTREAVAALDYAKYGNLADLTAQIAEANARAGAAEARVKLMGRYGDVEFLACVKDQALRACDATRKAEAEMRDALHREFLRGNAAEARAAKTANVLSALVSRVAELTAKLESWIDAIDRLKEFEDQNPNNTTLKWEKHLCAVHDAEAAARAALRAGGGE